MHKYGFIFLNNGLVYSNKLFLDETIQTKLLIKMPESKYGVKIRIVITFVKEACLSIDQKSECGVLRGIVSLYHNPEADYMSLYL